MIKILPESAENVIGVEVAGKVTIEEEQELIAKADALVAEYGRINVLMVLGEEAGWGFKAGMADLKWCMAHMKNFNKLAIVTGSTIWKWLVKTDAQFAKLAHISEKHFEPTELADAWEWVKS